MLLAVCEPHREVPLSSPAVSTGMLSITVVVTIVSFFPEHNKPMEEQIIGRTNVTEKVNAQWRETHLPTYKGIPESLKDPRGPDNWYIFKLNIQFSDSCIYLGEFT